MSHKMQESDYQPLIDKVKKRFSSWMVRHLSFVGRLQLLQSVVYSQINYWASIFILPMACIYSLEKLCNAYLWTGSLNAAKGAKVSWQKVCTPKKSGGLGLRRLADWNQVLGLKLLWSLRQQGDSLWVSWTWTHIIRHINFWDNNLSRRGSWLFRNLMKLRPLARSFIYCNVGDGKRCLYWQDNWTGRGPLLQITGSEGPRVAGIPHNATLHQATLLHGSLTSHSRNPLLTILQANIPTQIPISETAGPDSYSWSVQPEFNPLSASSSTFHTKETWRKLHPFQEIVPWYKFVWFPQRIPKHSFLAWLAMLNRLPTRTKLLSWGINVPSNCLLCDAANETCAHLFFNCSYVIDLWDSFFTYSSFPRPLDPQQITLTLQAHPKDKQLYTTTKILIHAIMYHVWQERNARLHTSIARPSNSLAHDINKQMRSKLLGLMNESHMTRDTPLTQWFGHYDLSTPSYQRISHSNQTH